MLTIDDLPRLVKMKNKTFNDYKSLPSKSIMKDNLLTCLYIIKFPHQFKKNDNVHMNKIITGWKAIIKNLKIKKIPSQELGNALKMNITVDSIRKFTKRNAVFTDALLSIQNKLYRPIILLSRSGGAAPVPAQAFRSLSLASTPTAKLPKNVKPIRANVPQGNVSSDPSKSPANANVMKCSIKLNIDSHKYIFDEDTFDNLKRLEGLNVVDQSDKNLINKLNLIIKAGYHWIENDVIIKQSLESFYSFNNKQDLYNLVFALHASDTLLSCDSSNCKMFSIAIENKRQPSVVGGSKKKGGRLLFGVDMPAEKDLKQYEPRRHIQFVLFQNIEIMEGNTFIRTIPYLRVVVKIGNLVDNDPYIKEAENYLKFKEINAHLQNSKNYTPHKKKENDFYNNNITKFFNQGHTDRNGMFRIEIDGLIDNNRVLINQINFAFLNSPHNNKKTILDSDGSTLFTKNYANQYFFIIERDDSFETLQDTIERCFAPYKTYTNKHKIPTINESYTYSFTLFNEVNDCMKMAMLYYGFSHRDLKPDNILISKVTSRAKIFDLDFSGFIFETDQLTEQLSDRTLSQKMINYNSEPLQRYGIPMFQNLGNSTKNLDIVYKLLAHDIWRMYYIMRCYTLTNHVNNSTLNKPRRTEQIVHDEFVNVRDQKEKNKNYPIQATDTIVGSIFRLFRSPETSIIEHQKNYINIKDETKILDTILNSNGKSIRNAMEIDEGINAIVNMIKAQDKITPLVLPM